MATAPVESRSLGLFLVEGFALMSYAAVIEPFRAANLLAGRTLYDWAHISRDGAAVRASNGAIIAADRGIDAPPEGATLFVFAGGDPTGPSDPALLAWLRKAAAAGATIAGVSAGPYLLARAGLLDGHRATIHWEHRPAFAEAFPEARLEDGLYVIDRRRVTCAGGLAGMDLAVELIAREQGRGLAIEVGDWLIRGAARAADRPQRLDPRARYGTGDDRVLRVLARMEACVEEPVARVELARLADLSLRQLERAFRRALGETVAGAYLRIRLEQARQLLRSTRQTVTAVGLACGFRSSSHFSRAYAARYGRSPSLERGPRGAQIAAATTSSR